MARRSYQPTSTDKATVKALAGYGIPQADICKVITYRDKRGREQCITLKTLRKHFREELDSGLVIANSKVAQTLYAKATNPKGGQGSVTAAIFWLKARAGWRDGADKVNESGPPVRFIIEGA